MEQVWFVAALWLGLALIATLLAIWFRVSTALSEIVVGTVAQLLIGALAGAEALGVKSAWITFLAGTGAIVLTFLAGAELDPSTFRARWKEAGTVGLVGFLGPFLGCSAVSYFFLGWSGRASLLTGIALSTTSVAVVYAVMLELGFNRTNFGKAILASCFINDLGTVIALGLIFAPFTVRTVIFLAASFARLHNRHGDGGRRGAGPYFGAPPADAYVRLADAVLLYPRRVVCVCSGSAGGALRFCGTLLRQNALEDRRLGARDSGIPLCQTGRPLLFADDVHRAHLLYDFGVVRAEPRRHYPSAVFVSCRGRDRQRGHTYHGGQRVLPAQAPAARAGAGLCG